MTDKGAKRDRERSGSMGRIDELFKRKREKVEEKGKKRKYLGKVEKWEVFY